MSAPFKPFTKHLGHLGLIAQMCKELKIAEQVDRLIPSPDDKLVSYGELLVAMIINGLGFTSRPLHLFPEFFANKDLPRLLRPGIEAKQLNDSALGRAMDKFFEFGVTELFSHLASNTVKTLDLKVETVNQDITSFHVDGNYDTESDTGAVTLTHGYSRDHRPDLKQVVLHLLVEQQAGIPLYMSPANGNANDKTEFYQLVKEFKDSVKSACDSKYHIGDSALYVKETIQALAKQERIFISRVPAVLTQAKQLINQITAYKLIDFADGYRGCWIDSGYAGVKQKWLLIQSEAAKEKEMKTLGKRLQKQTDKAIKSFIKLNKEAFSCEQDARKALAKWQKSSPIMQVNSINIREKARYKNKGQPAKDAQPDYFEYFIEGILASSLTECERIKTKCGCFILATNEINNLDMAELLSQYKGQQRVERGFKFLKSPEFFTSAIFLKKPERIEALLMIMTLCLMVYNALEHRIRKGLRDTGQHFPDQKKKPSQKPTARWIFHCFSGITVMYFEQKNGLIANLEPRHSSVLNALGKTYQEMYS